MAGRWRKEERMEMGKKGEERERRKEDRREGESRERKREKEQRRGEKQ